MKLLCTLLLFSSLAGAAQRNPAVAKAHKTTHRTQNSTILNSGFCSATAIGPHALLTASHCELPTSALVLDGEPRTILETLRDGEDHTIYLLDGKEFSDVAALGNSLQLEAGDAVFIFGNPGEFSDMYRSGTVAQAQDKHYQIIFSLDSYGGDSGAAIFNEDGAIVAVVSAVYVQNNGGLFIKLTRGFALAFTPEQLRIALSFVTPTK